MTESMRRKGDNEPVLDDEAQKKKDRTTLLIFAMLAFVVIVGMLWVAGFLSGN